MSTRLFSAKMQHDYLLRVLHFKFLQNLNCWRRFFVKHIKEQGITRRSTEQSAALFLISIFSTRISHQIDEALFVAELERQTPVVREYIKQHGEKIFKYYSTAYGFLLKEKPTYENYYNAGRLIYHQLFECDLEFDLHNHNETAEEQLLMDCSMQMDEIFWRDLSFSIYANDCASGKKTLGFVSNEHQLSRDDKKVIKQFAAVRKSLHKFFLQRRACYVDKIAFEFELDILSFFIVYEVPEGPDVSILCKQYPILSFEFVGEEAVPLYREASQKGKLGHTAYTRLCCAAGTEFDLYYLSQIYISEAEVKEAEDCISSISARFSASFSDRQKIFFGFAAVGVLMLALAILRTFRFWRYDFPNGFFVFLRIVVCCALVGLVLEKFPVWLKFILILLAILYNPVFPVHLGDADIWMWLNIFTIPALTVPWILTWIKKGRL